MFGSCERLTPNFDPMLWDGSLCQVQEYTRKAALAVAQIQVTSQGSSGLPGNGCSLGTWCSGDNHGIIYGTLCDTI